MFGDRADLGGIAEGQKLAVSEVREWCIWKHFLAYTVDIWPTLLWLCCKGCAPSHAGRRRGRSHSCSSDWCRPYTSVFPLCPRAEVQPSFHGDHHWSDCRKHAFYGQDCQPKHLREDLLFKHSFVSTEYKEKTFFGVLFSLHSQVICNTTLICIWSSLINKKAMQDNVKQYLIEFCECK